MQDISKWGGGVDDVGPMAGYAAREDLDAFINNYDQYGQKRGWGFAPPPPGHAPDYYH